MLMFNSALNNTTKHQYFQTKYHIMYSQSCIIDSQALRLDYRCDPSWNTIINNKFLILKVTGQNLFLNTKQQANEWIKAISVHCSMHLSISRSDVMNAVCDYGELWLTQSFDRVKVTENSTVLINQNKILSYAFSIWKNHHLYFLFQHFHNLLVWLRFINPIFIF